MTARSWRVDHQIAMRVGSTRAWKVRPVLENGGVEQSEQSEMVHPGSREEVSNRLGPVVVDEKTIASVMRVV